MELETTIDKLNKATEEYEEKDKLHAEVEPNPSLAAFCNLLKNFALILILDPDA